MERNSLKSETAEKDAQIEKMNEQLSRLEDQINSKDNNQTDSQRASPGENEDNDDDDDMSHSLLIQQKDKIIAEKD